MTFSEVRPYQYGDDIRSIDWNVTAKTGIPHIKIFEEERELAVLLAVDISASTRFGGKAPKRIYEQITNLCASLAVSAHQAGDKVGVLLFSSGVDYYLPPAKGRNHLMRILKELVAAVPATGGETNMVAALDFLNRVLKRHHLIFLVSDFLAADYRKALSLLGQKHEVVGIRIWDRFFDALPPAGFIRVLDPEKKQMTVVDFGSPDRADIARLYADYTAYYKDAFAWAKSDELTVYTDESVYKRLLVFFESRKTKPVV